MWKIVAVGVWMALVTAASAYLAPMLLAQAAEGSAAQEPADLGVEELRTDMTSVPMIRDGEILGYVIMQLSFAADRGELQRLKLEPQPYLVDAAFRTVFANAAVDFRRMRPSDVEAITRGIAEEANRRLGGKLVRNVLIQQLNFVKKEDIRTNWIGKGEQAP